MSGPVLRLVPAGPPFPEPEVLERLARDLAPRMGRPVLPGEPLRIRADWRADPPSRIPSAPLVDSLANRDQSDLDTGDWSLAVTAADLFATDRDFVFGEATLGARWAVVSSARLHPTPPDDDLLHSRLLRECLHEIGHLAGLEHCPHLACVMAFSATAADVDRKNSEFCPDCQARLIHPGGA